MYSMYVCRTRLDFPFTRKRHGPCVILHAGTQETWIAPRPKTCWPLAPTGPSLCDKRTPESSPSASSEPAAVRRWDRSFTPWAAVHNTSPRYRNASNAPLCLWRFCNNRSNMEIRHIKVNSVEGLFRINDKKAFKGLIVSHSPLVRICAALIIHPQVTLNCPF